MRSLAGYFWTEIYHRLECGGSALLSIIRINFRCMEEEKEVAIWRGVYGEKGKGHFKFRVEF